MNSSANPLILNVDDNDGARYAKSRILSRAGFTVLEAATGTEALEKVLSHAPGLILLDVKLPDINGLEVCRRIKADAATAHTLILQTSAAALHSADRVRALDGGADSYLTEPIDPAELIANVRALLRLRQAEEQFRHAEQALRESEERFRQMAENIADVFWMVDPATNELLYVSPAYRVLWGRDPATLGSARAHWSHGVHPDDAAQVERAYSRLAELGHYEQEYRVARPDGSIWWIRERGFPVRDAGGRVYRLAGIASDVSERRAHESQLQEGDRRKDQFLAMLAHELRNPLAPIRNAIEVLDPARSLSALEHDNARRIMGRQIDHLSRLVDDLLDVSRITQGKITLRQQPVDLKGAIAAAIDTVRPAIEKKRHRLTVELPDETLVMRGDPVRIAQVVGNLLSNAAKYTPEEGRIEVCASANQVNCALVVRDDGVGIAADILPHIFDLFVQSESSLERSDGGLGIGLSLAKTLVELHGGEISVASSGLGRGSEFVVTLPLLEAQAEGLELFEAPPQASGSTGSPRQSGFAAKAAGLSHNNRMTAANRAAGAPDTGAVPAGLPSATSAGAPRRVLLVDDSRDAAEAMGYLLDSLGYEVQVAHDGLAALAMADSFDPEVVILDIGLPGMDGFQVAEQLRKRPRTANVLLIALTGYGQASDRQRSSQAGFDHHLVKPVSVTDIEAVIAARFGN